MERIEAEEKIIELWRRQIGRSGEAPFMIVDCEHKKGYKTFYEARIADIIRLDDDVLSFIDGEAVRTIKLEEIQTIR